MILAPQDVSVEGVRRIVGTLDGFRWASVAMLSFALFAAAFQILADTSGPMFRIWGRYVAALERKLRALFIFAPGARIAKIQLLLMFAVFALHVSVTVPLWWAVLAMIAMGPTAYLESERRKRIALLESQIDGFLVALSNALKATPSIGAAFGSLVSVINDPMRQEVSLALKEIKVGSSLEQALLSMAARVGSRQLDSALSSILIGRQVGGNLPKVLDTTAGTLREMKRLEGVIRTKTADGRMQMWVIGTMPLICIVLFGTFWPGYFNPLTQSSTGYVIIGGVAVLWVSALIIARKVLAVDI